MITSESIRALYDAMRSDTELLNEIFTSSLTSELVSTHRPLVQNHNTHGYREWDPSSAFLPIRVNPSIPTRSVLLRETFVYAQDKETEVFPTTPERSRAINYSKNTLDSFVDETLQSADLLAHAMHDESGTMTQNLSIMQFFEGKKGVGKTHLQNFILTNYSDKFDQNKTIWVRVNLVREFGAPENVTLTYWIRAQLTKIMTRYYDVRSEHCTKNRTQLEYNYRKHLTEFIRQEEGQSQEEVEHRLSVMRNMLDCFQLKGGEMEISPEWMPMELVNEIYRIITQKLDLRIIVVIDGIDLLSESQVAREKYEFRISALTKYLSSETAIRCYNLVFIRPKTRECLGMLKATLQGTNTYHGELDNTLPIASCNTMEIIRKRISFPMMTGSMSSMSTNNVREFINYLESTESDILDDEGNPLTWMRAINQLTHENARSVTQIVSSIASVASTFSGNAFNTDMISSYQFIEYAMLGKQAFPPLAYTYYIDTNDALKRKIGAMAFIYDTIFVPSIFSFPYKKNETSENVFRNKNITKYLCTLRILQFMELYEKFNNTRADLEELILILSDVYAYDVRELELIIEELSESEVIDVKPRMSMHNSWDIKYYDGSLSLRGKRILNDFVFDIAYLAMASFVAPLPQNLCIKRLNKPEVFRVTPPSSKNVSEWVETKVLNGLSFMKIIKCANEQQKIFIGNKNNAFKSEMNASYDIKWKKILAMALDMNSNIYTHCDSMETSIINSGAKALNGYSTSTASLRILKNLLVAVEG